MRLQEKVLGSVAELVIRRHKVIVLIGAILVVLSVAAMNRIQIKTQIKDMMSADNPKVKSFDEMTDRFTGGSAVIILVEGADKAMMIAAAEELGERISSSPAAMRYVRNIDMKSDTVFFADWSLLLRKPDDIRTSALMWRDINLVNYFRALNATFEQNYTGDDADQSLETAKEENEAVLALTQIETTVEGLTAAINRQGTEGLEAAGAALANIALFGEAYQFSPDGTLLLFSVSPNFASTDLTTSQTLMTEIMRLEKETASHYPGISFGNAGDIPGNSDLQNALGADMLYPTLIAYILLFVLFLFSFDSIRSIFFMLISLTVGILFNYGIVGVTLGQINMLTSILGALLVGMGIDYGIQIVTSYSGFLAAGEAPDEALRTTFSRSGSGVLLAALTTAAAFFVFMFSTSTALRQFGLVAGTGIITCFLAMILFLPSLLLWFGKKGTNSKKRLPQINYAFLTTLGLKSARRKWIVIPTAAVLVIGAGIFAVRTITLEYDMMKLQPQNVPSTIASSKMLERFGRSSSSASIGINTIEEAQTLTEKLETLRDVLAVLSVSQYIPSGDKQDERLAVIRSLRETPPNTIPLAWDETDLEALQEAVQLLEWNIIEIGDLSVAGLGDENRIVRERNRIIREIFGAEVGREGKEVFQNLIQAVSINAGGEEHLRLSQNLAALDRGFSVRLQENAERMLAAVRRVTPADLPDSVKRSLFDESGQYNLLTVFPSAQAMEDSSKLLDFSQELDRIDQRISGLLPVSVMWMREIQGEAVKIAIILFILVFVMMLFSFRNIRYALIAMIPLAVGILLMFGLIALFRIQFSAFNLALTPAVIGIGIAYGSYLLQRYLVENQRLDSQAAQAASTTHSLQNKDAVLDTTLHYTTKAIFLSAFTSMMGFGSLWIAAHFAAIASVGALIFLGILSVLMVTLILLPALLSAKK